METKLQQEMNNVLSKYPVYWENGILLKTKVIDDLREYNQELIASLLDNEYIKKAYAFTFNQHTVIKLDDLISVLRYKNYWDNSYTKFSNEIGLASDGRYLKYNSDVVLDFPHKDCVLEGGMSKEDTGKNENYYHCILAREEIDVLLSPKVLTNIKKFDAEGEHQVVSFSDEDNLILKGNNLIALHSLKNRYAYKAKLIIIDPPYNTGGDSFKYNDRFNHSTWLTFMRNRLEVARSLLVDGGSIWVNIDDNEVHYLKVLMDEVFPNGFVANVVWQKRTSPDARSPLGDAHEHILVYSNNVVKFKEQLKTIPLTEEQKKRFKNPDNDPRGEWVSSDFTAQGYRPNQMYTITTPSGKEYSPPPGSCWKRVESEYQKLRDEGRMWFGKNGDGMPRRKTYLSESAGQVAWTWWTNNEVGHNQEAKKESIALFGSDQPFSTPKPERLIHRIISLCTDEGDLVIDFFSGSGTTVATAHKMKRQYIGIEQINYELDYMPERLKKVIVGEQGGISKVVEWQGGGSFIYAELQELNMHYIHLIQAAKNNKDLHSVIKQMKESAFLNFKADIAKVSDDNNNFATLALDEKKQLLIEVLDANQLYLNYSEIDDTKFNVSESVKAFNNSFYQKDGVIE